MQFVLYVSPEEFITICRQALESDYVSREWHVHVHVDCMSTHVDRLAML